MAVRIEIRDEPGGRWLHVVDLELSVLLPDDPGELVEAFRVIAFAIQRAVGIVKYEFETTGSA